jgi:hypothetical protein
LLLGLQLFAFVQDLRPSPGLLGVVWPASPSEPVRRFRDWDQVDNVWLFGWNIRVSGKSSASAVW